MNAYHQRVTPPPAKYFFAVMTGEDAYHKEAEERLEARLGPIEDRSERYLFSEYATYYEREMGSPLWKYFLTLRQLESMDSLVEVKLFVEEVEQQLAVSPESGTAGDRSRTVNLDPGYVTGWSLVLATVKNRAHRIYLGQGIFAEVTLIYRDRAFQPLPWTYPDYAAAATRTFLAKVRAGYLRQLREAEDQLSVDS